MGKRKKDRIYEGFKCVDCGVNTHDADEYYMVHDELWAAAGMEPAGGMLCVGCLEQRLGCAGQSRFVLLQPSAD